MEKSSEGNPFNRTPTARFRGSAAMTVMHMGDEGKLTALYINGIINVYRWYHPVC